MPASVAVAELVAAAELGPGLALALALVAAVEAAVVSLVDAAGEAAGVVVQGYQPLDLPAAVVVGEAARRIGEGLS